MNYKTRTRRQRIELMEKIHKYYAKGYTMREIAEKEGVSLAMVSLYLNGKAPAGFSKDYFSKEKL